jgi:hypothetical protein
MESFELALGAELHPDHCKVPRPESDLVPNEPTVWLNLALDTLFVSKHFGGLCYEESGWLHPGLSHAYITLRIKGLRSVAFEVKDFEADIGLYDALEEFLVYHRNLQEITLVIARHIPNDVTKGKPTFSEVLDIGILRPSVQVYWSSSESRVRAHTFVHTK